MSEVKEVCSRRAVIDRILTEADLTTKRRTVIHPGDITTRYAPFVLTDDQQAKQHEIRTAVRNFAAWLDTKIPESREKSLAYTKLEEVVFWAGEAIRRNDG